MNLESRVVETPGLAIEKQQRDEHEFMRLSKRVVTRTRSFGVRRWDKKMGRRRKTSSIRCSGDGCRPLVVSDHVWASSLGRRNGRLRSTPKPTVREMVGRKLPTEAQFHRAAYGTLRAKGTPLPGTKKLERQTGKFLIFKSGIPLRLARIKWRQRIRRARSGWKRMGMDADGVAPFPGLTPMPFYAVICQFLRRQALRDERWLAGRSVPARRSFRTGFSPQDPYVYATFRGVEDDEPKSGRFHADLFPFP